MYFTRSKGKILLKVQGVVCVQSSASLWSKNQKKNDCKDHKSIQFIAIIMPFTVPHKIWETVDIKDIELFNISILSVTFTHFTGGGGGD